MSRKNYQLGDLVFGEATVMWPEGYLSQRFENGWSWVRSTGRGMPVFCPRFRPFDTEEAAARDAWEHAAMTLRNNRRTDLDS